MLVVGISAEVRAHRGSTKYLRVEQLDQRVRLEADIEAVDVAVGIGVGERTPIRDILSRRSAIARWIVEGIQIRSGKARCDPRVDSITEQAPSSTRLVPILRTIVWYECESSSRTVLLDRTVFNQDPQHQAIVRLAFAGDAHPHILRAGRQQVALASPPSGWQKFVLFLVEGAAHFASGYDHVLFLLSLLLLAGFVVRARGRRAAGKQMVVLVTAFTLGHSVTLTLSALDVVRLPAQPVEAAIAASIMVVAVYNAFVSPTREAKLSLGWAFGMTASFGLVHGLGFSAVLGELGLPADQRIISLLAFNVGIELGQLGFVVICLAPIAWLAGRAWYAAAVRGASWGIGTVALYWFVERVGVI